MSEPSSCSCDLPDDMYGFGGWHHRVVGQAYWRDRIWVKEYQGTTARRSDHVGYDKERGRKITLGDAVDRRAQRMPSIVAVERCPRYRAAVVKGINRRRAEGSNGTRSDAEGSW